MPLALEFAAKPFAEQSAFFRQKLNLPTAGWRDIEFNAHDRGFVIAGAQKADLIADFRAAVQTAIDGGGGLEAFRKDFDAIVARHGWAHVGSRDWRSRVIYQTNLLTSYSAGRLVQLKQAAADGLWWMYRHSDSVMYPRPLHVAWDKYAMPATATWWSTHYPPNGWGCKCYVVAIHPDRITAKGGRIGPPPDDGTDPKTGGPVGIDDGWAYQPGASVADEIGQIVANKSAALAERDIEVSRAYVASTLELGAFERWVGAATDGEWPVAVLDQGLRDALGVETDIVWLSAETARKQIKHPEIGPEHYRLIQRMVDEGEVYAQGETRIVMLWSAGRLYRAAIKRTGDGLKNYFLSLFETGESTAERGVRERLERIR